MRRSLIPWTATDWTPSRLLREFDRDLAQLFGASSSGLHNANNTMADFEPACDIDETDTHYVVRVDLPGLNKEDVKVDLSENRLTIAGERRIEKEGGQKHERWTERRYGTFMRSFTFPQAVDNTQVEASFERGVLNVVVGKSVSVKPRSIEVQEGRGSLIENYLETEKTKKSD